MRRQSYRGAHIPIWRSKLWKYTLHGEVLHLASYLGMAHREWGQCRKHVERSRVRVEDLIDKVKDREESHLVTTAEAGRGRSLLPLRGMNNSRTHL